MDRSPTDTPKSRRRPVATLVFRGFSYSPEEVESLVGKAAEHTGRVGLPTAPGRRPLVRSFVSYEVTFPFGCRLDEMVPGVISHAGGIEALVRASAKIKPEFLEVDLLLPVRDSPEQEGGFIDQSAIKMLDRLGATLSLGFASHWAEA